MSGAFEDARNTTGERHALEESEYANLQRYTRTKLYALRNNARSQRRPDCALRSELQCLSFWKFTSAGGSVVDDVGHVSNDAPNTVGSSSSAMPFGSQFPANMRGRERQLNLRERPMGHSNRSIRSAAVDSTFTHTNSPTQKANFLDQRSNSIAHLMPAFAKKRIAAAAAQHQNHNTSNSTSSVEYSETRDRDNEGAHNTNYEAATSRVRGKEHGSGFEQQKRHVNDSVEYISPHRRVHAENERDSSGGRGGGGGSNMNSRYSGSLHERRIGSGRLLPRDVNWEYHEKNSTATQARHGTRYTERVNSNTSGGSSSYHERKNVGNNTADDSYASNTHGTGRRYNTDEHGRHQRHSYRDKNDEPEWFSGGPTSQNDIIELRGFDEPIEIENEQSSEHNACVGDGSLSQSSSSYDLTAANSEQQTKSSETPPVETVSIAEKAQTEPSAALVESEHLQQKKDMSKEFNFDVIFNLDTLETDIMRSGNADTKKDSTSGGSRFSRWFANSTSPNETLTEKDADTLKDSPKAANVLEFFQNAKAAGPQKLEMPSVEELEAKMRKVDTKENAFDVDNVNMDGVENTQKGPASRDLEAFQKILQQLNNGNAKRDVAENEAVANCISPPQQNLGMFPLILPTEMPQILPQILTMGATNPEEMLRVAQMQPQQFPALTPTQQMDMHATQKTPYMNDTVTEQQKRRDFVNLHHAVTRGHLPLSYLEKELCNPNIPIQSKEVITAVIRETTRSLTPSLNILNNQAQLTPVHLMRGSPIHQQGIHSPIPMTVLSPTQIAVPSNQIIIQPTHPTEQINQTAPLLGMPNLQDTHMRSQAIMQNVIMKKKMEEQQQDATRRQNEFQKQQCENSQLQQLEQQSPQHQVHTQNSVTQTRHLNSPTPLAFTPTSVLRKMTAEKDNGNAQMQQQTQQQHKTLPQMQQNKATNHAVFFNQNPQLPAGIPQPRMILGGNPTTTQMTTVQQPPPHTQHLNQPISPQTLPSNLQPHQQQQQQRVPPNEAKWQLNLAGQQGNMTLNKPMGRPILKGPPPAMAMPISQQGPQQQMQLLGHLQPTAQQNPQVPSMLFPAKLDMSQQRLKNNQTPQHVLNAQPAPQGFVSTQHVQQPMPQNVLHIQHQQQLFQMHHMSLQQQQHMQLQRQLHQQMHTQPTTHTQQQPPQQQQQQHETTNRSVNFAQSPPLTNSTNNANSSSAAILCPREGGLSPTSNQLAQWFSPELLAQATAGKLPQINMNQALSLEEFERNIQQHSSTVVNN